MADLTASCPGPLVGLSVEQSMNILLRAQAGDQAALDQLASRYQERLLRIARIRLGPEGNALRRFVDSGDVVQETWKAALNGLRDLKVSGDTDLLNWLARIAANKIRDMVDHIHAQRRSVEREQAWAELPSSEPLDSSRGPQSRAANAELCEMIDSSLAELDEDYREVIVLRDYCGTDWESIAARLGRANSHAAQQLHQRAWIKLRKKLGPRLGST